MSSLNLSQGRRPGLTDFGLVETLAECVAELILSEFPVGRVNLKLSKPGAVRGARAVGVKIVREKEVVA